MSINNCILYSFHEVKDRRGNLTFIENSKDIPFDIKRIYYLYDIPGGSERGGHAHKNLYQIIISVFGSFDVILDDGSNVKTVNLSSASEGLLVVPMIWREIKNFSAGAVCLVLASDFFSEDDYYREKSEFISNIKK
jgi:dTDP-4-dehydrorhamnose 3,5-epimerase-like enzyme